MKMIDDEFVTSATDLATYMGCQHATHMDARSAAGEISRLYYDNAELDVLKLRGEAHEQAYLKHLKQKGKRGVALDRDAGAGALLQAMQAGADYIYQAYLQHDTWRGYADFLIKVDRSSSLGNWSYEVLDAKLARETRGETILQLCVYSELLAALQGLHPENAFVLTPGEFAPECYRLAEYSAYYRLVKRDFLGYLPGARQHKSYPEPCDKCERCDWYVNCEQRWRDDDHLTFVAGIQRSQRVELGEHKVSTLKSLAKLPLPILFGPKPDQGLFLLTTPARDDVFFEIVEGQIYHLRRDSLLARSDPHAGCGPIFTKCQLYHLTSINRQLIVGFNE